MRYYKSVSHINNRLYTYRWLIAGFWALVVGLAWPAATWAHPLGNFTINRYSRLEVGPEQIQLYYVVDVAEIPAIAEQQRLDSDGDGQLSTAERKQYLAGRVYALRRQLQLQVDGQPLELVPYQADLELPPGQGGLATVRLTIIFKATLPPSATAWQVEYRDDNYAGRRLGWQEIVVQAAPGVTLLESTAPAEDISQELRNYPPDLLQQPLQVRQATFRFQAGEDGSAGSMTVAKVAQPAAAQPPSEISNPPTLTAISDASSSDAFAELITIPSLGPGAILLALLAAFGWGTLHAFSPGHGKTVVAAYLVGSRGTARHALFLGLTTTLTHTTGVFALGGLTLLVSHFILPEQFYPWLGLISGLLVVSLGVSLLIGRWRQFSGSHHHPHDHVHQHDDTHEHSHADHPHPHPHPHGYEHSHLPPGGDGSPVTWRSLLALGISGGLLPCPSALIVMLSAIALNRVGFGLLLIVAFSMGLASVLTATGLLFVYAGRLFNPSSGVSWLPARAGVLVKWVPLASMLVVTVLGLGITLQALLQMGVLTL